MKDGVLWMCYYDRTGIICSRSFALVEDLYTFVPLIKALLLELSEKERGVIKGFERCDYVSALDDRYTNEC